MIAKALLLAFLSAGTPQQAPPAPAAAPQADQVGLPAPWVVKETIQQVQGAIKKATAALNQLQVLTWKGSGASNYVAVADSARRQVTAISVALARLAEQPDNLSAVVRMFLALEQLQPSLDSLSRAARQYQGPETGRELEDATNAVLNQREKFINYALELADFVEHANEANQQELESCRQQLWKRASQPVTPQHPRRP
jgi:uncharacterized protein YukE